MSAHELPEDLSRWPDNAYELLGVTPGVDPRELRRAYMRLIRTYKPEQYPEHFRRIREAYESVLRYAELFGKLGVSPEPEPEEVVPTAPSPSQSEETPAGYRPPEVSELWQMACDGDSVTAYRRLVQLDEMEPGRTEVCLAAYWLLMLEPELDSVRQPCDWLARGLAAARLGGPLRELYRREIAADPAEALSGRCDRLLRVPAPAGLVADLVEWRWQAAARLVRLATIGPDLQCLRPRLVSEDEETWLRLLLLAAGLLATNYSAGDYHAIYQTLQREIAAYQHLHHRLGYAFDQYEFQSEVGEGLESASFDSRSTLLPGRGRIPGIIRELVGLTQVQPFAETRPRLLAFLEEWTPQPNRLLACFDQLRKEAPAVLSELGNLIQQLADSVPQADDDRDFDDCQELIESFWAECPRTDDRKFRLALLAFCVHEAISPQRAANLFEESLGAERAQQIRDDWPLQHAWLACHTMGA